MKQMQVIFMGAIRKFWLVLTMLLIVCRLIVFVLLILYENGHKIPNY